MNNLALIAIALVAGCGMVAQRLPPRVGFGLKTSTVDAGEPVVLIVTVQNSTGADQSAPLGRYEVDWVVRSQDGREVAHYVPQWDVASLVAHIPARAARSFDVVASGTSAIQVPGQYEMTVNYHPLGVSEHLQFKVVAASRAALGQLAQSLHDAAVHDTGQDGLTAAEALTSMAYAVPPSMLCDVMEQNPATTYAVAPRLEADGSREAAECLVRAMIGSPSHRDEIRPILERLAQREEDAGIREEIRKAIVHE